MRPRIPRMHSILAQMVPSLVSLVLLTALAAGVPALWLVHDQLERRAWAQVEQARLSAEALYAAQEAELDGLTTLAAQRPTLLRLFAEGDTEALSAYLADLRQGSGLDLVMVCDLRGRVVARAGQFTEHDKCAPIGQPHLRVFFTGATPQAWLLASHPLPETTEEPVGTVMAGFALDRAFVSGMRERTGLEHTVLINGAPVMSSLDGRPLGEPAAVGSRSATRTVSLPNRFSLEERPYFAARLDLDGSALQAEVALDATDIVSTRRRLVGLGLAGIVAASGLASLFALLTARRISRPLIRLAGAAQTLSTGDPGQPLRVETRVREVALLAQALERARADLLKSMAELRQEKAWADHLLEAIVEGIATLDRKGAITFFSHGAERITGWQRSEVIGQSCDAVFRPVEAEEAFSQLLPPPGQRRNIPVALRRGRQAVLAVTGARLVPPEGGDARVALVFRDITEEEAAHRLLGDFLANVAHEFRTPLSALAASVELLLDQAPDLNDAELQELLTSLYLGVLGLQTLIDNLLESASIQAGHFQVHPRPSNLADILAEAVQIMRPLLEKHGQRLMIELPAALPVVQADPRRTVQVLVNLLSNASKHGPDTSEIEVRAVAQGEWIRIGVADSGPGVPAEYRHDLYRRFRHRGSGDARSQVGTGLGLSVVKTIVEGHGGEVGVDDHEGGGAVFWFTLPVTGG